MYHENINVRTLFVHCYLLIICGYTNRFLNESDIFILNSDLWKPHIVKWNKNPKFLKVKFPKKLIKYCSLCVYFVFDKLDNVFCRCAMLRLIKLLYLRLSFFSFQQQNQNTYLYNVKTFLFFLIKRRMKSYFKSVYLVIALSWIDFVHFKYVMEYVKVNQKYVDNVAIGHIIFHEKHI